MIWIGPSIRIDPVKNQPILRKVDVDRSRSIYDNQELSNKKKTFKSAVSTVSTGGIWSQAIFVPLITDARLRIPTKVLFKRNPTSIKSYCEKIKNHNMSSHKERRLVRFQNISNNTG